MDTANLKKQFQELIDRGPQEDWMEPVERLLIICHRISAMRYGARQSEPAHTITAARCNKDAAWLAEYASKLLE